MFYPGRDIGVHLPWAAAVREALRYYSGGRRMWSKMQAEVGIP